MSSCSQANRKIAEDFVRQGRAGKYAIRSMSVKEDGTIHLISACDLCGSPNRLTLAMVAEEIREPGHVKCVNFNFHRSAVPETAQQFRERLAREELAKERAAAAAKEAARVAAEQAEFSAALDAMRPDYEMYRRYQVTTDRPIISFEVFASQSEEIRSKIMNAVRSGRAYQKAREQYQ